MEKGNCYEKKTTHADFSLAFACKEKAADAFVLYEDEVSPDAVCKAYEKIFRTECGKKICRNMFGIA